MYMHCLGEGRVPRKISFQELHVRVGEIAAALKSFGVKKGDRIAGKKWLYTRGYNITYVPQGIYQTVH